MAMIYTQVETSRVIVRDEVIDYLRENQERLVLSQPSSITGSTLYWFDATKKVGKSVNEVADEVYQRLTSSGKAKCTDVRVNDSTIMNAYNAYIPLHTKIGILEEILELVRVGVLILARLAPKNEGVNYDFMFDLATDFVILTEYGRRFLDEEPAIPYFAEPYLERLRQIAEPDDELQGYLSEGLACLRNHLGRAAAILLRTAVEHTLNVLIESTTASIKQDKERQKFKGQIRSAGIRIEERAEVVFKKLESSALLIPNKPYFGNMVSHRLRPALHSIRDLGGKAAHLSSTIQLAEVVDHYTLYVGTVYAITTKIIQHQKALR